MKQQSISIDTEFRDFIADLFGAAAALQSVRRAIARRTGIGGTEFGIMLAVARLVSDGPVNVSLVAKHLHVAAAHITAEVNALVKLGLLKKIASPIDSRAVQLTISPEGQILLKSLAPVLRRMNKAMFDALPKDVLTKHGNFCRDIIARTPATLAALAASSLDPVKPARITETNSDAIGSRGAKVSSRRKL